MPTIANASDALELLANHLQLRFDADFASDFEHGVRVLKEEQEPDSENEDADDIGSPYLALWVNSDDREATWGHWARRLTIGVKCVATEFNGALVGAANPVAAHIRMSEVLSEIIEDDYPILRDMGLMNAEMRGRRPSRSEEQITYLKPHEISVIYLTRGE